MADTFGLKLKEFEKTLMSLKRVLDEKENDITRDSVIKRFEYTFELCWKTAKVMLTDRFGVDIFSPKGVFRELRKNYLLTDEEAEMFLKATDDRNEIIHTYNENFSLELYKKIKADYYPLFEKILIIFKK